ncbi:MAG TPA: protein kinase, partial [Thermoanaerobaculia bacterium]|nr:protein kinase [Thermoanaerobaculia bacterium]
MIGATLLHYRIVEALGRGGMGEVYAAEDTKLGRRVALKLLPQEMAADTERLRRFQREAQALALLNHPNLVTIYAVEEAAETHFITMELVEGKTLGELTPPRGWPIREFLRLAIPLADAIGTAHLRGIIHRDLKPANVMVGSDGRVKVLDFGLAKLKQEDVGSAEVSAMTTTAQLTAKHSVFGTAAYMSPEQAEGHPLDHRTDIFSLGIVLYELATGRRPFQGDTAVSVISSILRDSPPPPAQVNPDLPGDLDRIIGHCLAKDPARRYQSALDVRNDLQELQQRAESPERLADASRTTISISRTTRWRLGVAAAVALIAVGTYVLLRRGTPAGREHRAPLRATFNQLTTQPGVEWFPSLSPDGKWIAYSGEASGNRDI